MRRSTILQGQSASLQIGRSTVEVRSFPQPQIDQRQLSQLIQQYGEGEIEFSAEFTARMEVIERLKLEVMAQNPVGLMVSIDPVAYENFRRRHTIPERPVTTEKINWIKEGF
jgi:hypothetical protein